MPKFDEPICSSCLLESIVAMHGHQRCLDCGRLWDGLERADIMQSMTRESDTTCEVVIDILQRVLQHDHAVGLSVDTKSERI